LTILRPPGTPDNFGGQVKFLHRFYLILQSQYLTFHPRYSCSFKHQLNFLWKNSLTYTQIQR